MKTLDKSNFYKNKSRKSGYNSWCKECLSGAVNRLKIKYIGNSDLTTELCCTKCKLLLPVKGNFSKHAKEKSGYFPVCYTCQKLTYKHPDIVSAQWSRYSREVLLVNRNTNIDKIFTLLGNICAGCNKIATIDTFYGFDLHHINPNTKEFTVSVKLNKLWTPDMESEVRKCELLCACCHRQRHATRNPQSRSVKYKILEQLKKHTECTVCLKPATLETWSQFDLHHTKDNKTATPSDLLRKRSLTEAEQYELDSCKLYCAYCHNIYHNKQASSNEVVDDISLLES